MGKNSNKDYYRFKTRNEFEKEYGEYWFDRILWNPSGRMDYLFGTKLDIDFPDDVDYFGLPSTTGDGFTWIITKKMLVKTNDTPSYKPRKIERTLESVNSKHEYRFKTEKEFIDEYGDNWNHRINWNSYNDMDYLFGTKLDIDFPVNVGLVSIPRKYDPDDYWLIDKKMLTKVLILPSYKPRNIKRTLESVNSDNKYDTIVIKVLNESENEIIQNNLFKEGFRWITGTHLLPLDDYPVYLFVCDDSSITYMNDSTMKQYGGLSNYIKIRGYNIDKVLTTLIHYSNISNIRFIFKNGNTPSYKPKNISRLIESVEDGYLPYRIWCDDSKKTLDFEEFLHSMGYLWADNSKYILKRRFRRYGESNPHTFCHINFDKKTFDSYGEYYPGHDGDKIYKYPEDESIIKAILSTGKNIPSYKPRNIIRESIDSKILYAFDFDGTLVNSIRFEDRIRPMLNEFLTPESILISKVDDIGIDITDLRYENGRIYFDDPNRLIDISNKLDWVRKKDRIYITQPESYHIIPEGMPVETNEKIVELYNNAEYKSIITIRKDRLREQTIETLNNFEMEEPNCGLFMFPNESTNTKSKWKSNMLINLYRNHDFFEVHYFDDNIRLLRKMKKYLSDKDIKVILYYVNKNEYRKI